MRTSHLDALRAIDKLELALLAIEQLPLEPALAEDAQTFAEKNGLPVQTVVLAQLLLQFLQLGKKNHLQLTQTTARLLTVGEMPK